MTEVLKKFVVAFNRDRDHYQLPLALHEAGMLDRLVTDFYSGGAGCMVPRRLKNRCHPRLSVDQVEGVPLTVLAQLGAELGLLDGGSAFRYVDAKLSSKAAARAVTHGTHLFLYSNYAREAFLDPRLSDRAKGLFVFHPHDRFIRPILKADLEVFPECEWSFRNEFRNDEGTSAGRLDDECRGADLIVTASSFTKRSLIDQGYGRKDFVVAPYGAEIKTHAPKKRLKKKARFLFVGQGIQRKGLHHLLHAWSLANLTQAELHLVCSKLDPGIGDLAGRTKNVSISPSIPRSELEDLYSSSNVFVMPSLVEGFGLVYLEALARGCHVIATGNTGLPDLRLSEESCSLVPPADVLALSQSLVCSNEKVHSGAYHPEIIMNESSKYTWRHFRKQIVEAASTL